MLALMTDTAADGAAPAVPTPLLRIVAGTPSPAELAALVAVIAARGAALPAADPSLRSAWGAPRPTASVTVGAGAWVASGRAPGIRTRAGW